MCEFFLLGINRTEKVTHEIAEAAPGSGSRLYTFLYLCAVLGYIRFVQRGSKPAYSLSIACFIGSLLSKEAAVTLPLILCLCYLLVTPAFGSMRVRLYGAMRSTLVYAAIAAIYLLFVVGYLRVQAIDITGENSWFRSDAAITVE